MRLIIVILTWLLLSSVIAHATSVEDIKAAITSNNVAKIKILGAEFSKNNVSIFEIQDTKPRIVIDITRASSNLMRKGLFYNDNLSGVKAVRGANSENETVRFVIDLLPNTKMGGKTITTNEIVLEVQGAFKFSSSKANASKATATVTRDTNPTDIPVPRLKPKSARKPVIVIDAGHGGRDPGAIGGSGLQEKKVTLSAALELRRQLLATGRYKVFLSRARDRYIEHDDRLRVARANGADLFISLHADATDGKTARGVSVYTLADHAKKRSKRIVNSQNWIMDVNLSEQSDSVGDILVDLAQRNTASQSTKFADILIKDLGASTKLLRNTHRRAGYYVLLAPDVPAVLLELGFISNPQDERLLKTDKHKRKLMRSVTSAINRYFDRQNP